VSHSVKNYRHFSGALQQVSTGSSNGKMVLVGRHTTQDCREGRLVGNKGSITNCHCSVICKQSCDEWQRRRIQVK